MGGLGKCSYPDVETPTEIASHCTVPDRALVAHREPAGTRNAQVDTGDALTSGLRRRNARPRASVSEVQLMMPRTIPQVDGTVPTR